MRTYQYNIINDVEDIHGNVYIFFNLQVVLYDFE